MALIPVWIIVEIILQSNRRTGIVIQADAAEPGKGIAVLEGNIQIYRRAQVFQICLYPGIAQSDPAFRPALEIFVFTERKIYQVTVMHLGMQVLFLKLMETCANCKILE